MNKPLSSSYLGSHSAGALLFLLILAGGDMLRGSHSPIGILMGLLFVLPLLLIYSRLLKLCPGQNLFDMLQFAAGKWVSKLMGLLYGLFFLWIATSTLGFYARFIAAVSLPQTPILVLLIALSLAGIYLAWSRVESMGKFSLVIAFVCVVFFLILTLTAIPNIELSNLSPLLSQNPNQLFGGGIHFTELFGICAVLLLALTRPLNKKSSPYRIFFIATGAAVAVLLLTFTRDIAVLGTHNANNSLYPTFAMANALSLGSIGARIAFVAAIAMLFAGIGKIGISIHAAASATAAIFPKKEGEHPARHMVLPMGILTLLLSAGTIWLGAGRLNFLTFSPAISLIFTVAIPIILWIAAEIKTASQRKKT